MRDKLAAARERSGQTKPKATDDDGGPGLEDLLLALADDEFVIGFIDSEWTGIAPMLEEDIATSSISQDELGHATAFLRSPRRPDRP